MSKLTIDPALEPVARKVEAQERLTLEDGLALLASRDIHAIGRLAHQVRTRLHANKVFYNRNRHINYTNLCALSCRFCSFYRKRGEEGAYEMPVEQVVEVAQKAHQAGATEVHITGGLHPWQKFDYYLDMLRGIRAACPGLHIKAFTAVEIVHFSRIAHLGIRETLMALHEAGLNSMPGGGAEIFDDRVHDEIFKGKVRSDKWFEVHRTAHSLGIPSNATMLYGHVETPRERIGHLIKLRELQDEDLGGKAESRKQTSASSVESKAEIGEGRAAFNCLVPLSFVPQGSELGELPGPTGLSDLKTLAVSRLMLDNVPHIKAFWIMQSVGLSQVAMSWGCDDIDGTVVWYDITKRTGQGTHQEMTVPHLQRLIREAGFIPVERDTVYNEIATESRSIA